MKLERLNEVFCDVFDNPNIKLSEDSTNKDIEDWDSVAHIQLIFAIETEFDVQFEAEDIAKMTDVATILEALK